MLNKELEKELNELREFGLTEEEIEGYIEFYNIMKKRILNAKDYQVCKKEKKNDQ